MRIYKCEKCNKVIITKDELTLDGWKEIKAGDVVKGMNESEVKLVFGRPYNERKTGKRIKWMYEDNSVVVFTDGIVSTVIH